MTKTASLSQVTELGSRFLKDTAWGQIDHDALQEEVISLTPVELGRRITAFLKNGARLEVKGPSVLSIDRSKPFSPEKFIGKGWATLEEDERALLISNIDLSKVSFESALVKGETSITGEEKLVRLVSDGKIRLDAGVGHALFEEKGQTTLRFLYDTYGISWMEFAGTVLRFDNGYRYFLCLYRSDVGSWSWLYYWLGHDRGSAGVSPLLASAQI